MKTNAIIKNLTIMALIIMTNMGYASTTTNYCTLINNSGQTLSSLTGLVGPNGLNISQGEVYIQPCGSTQQINNFNLIAMNALHTNKAPIPATVIGQQVWTLNPVIDHQIGTITQASGMYTFTNNKNSIISIQIISSLSYTNNGTTTSASNIPAQTIAPGASLQLSLNPGTDSVTVSGQKKTGTLAITSSSKNAYSISSGKQDKNLLFS